MMSESTQDNSRTTTTVTVTTTKAEPVLPAGLQINPYYFKTIPGILKIVQLIVALICMGCCSPAYFGSAHFFLFVAAICFILTFVFMLIHFVCLPTAYPKIPWLLAELVFSGSAAIFYILASVILLGETDSKYKPYLYYYIYDSYIAAGVFGLINGILFGIVTFLLFKEYRTSAPATTAQQPPPQQ